MAISKSIEAKQIGVFCSKAYLKINRVIVDKHEANFQVLGYATKEARDLELGPVFLSEHSIPTEKFTGLASLYEHLKTLPEFEGAEDC